MTRMPAVRDSDVVKVLKRAGFIETRQKGSHVILWNEAKRLRTVVALHARDIPGPTLKQILKQAGLTEQEFLELL
jgi:predicted RNA binding protein YcfA (HicA-like mRNA interferase family)